MIFTADKLKEARDAGYSDDEIWSHVSSIDNRFNVAKSEGYSLDEVATFFSSQEPVGTSIGDTLQKTAEELEAGIGRAGSAFAKSAVGSVRMITDLFGANNAVSKEIAGVEDYIDQFTTAQAKQDKEEISRLFQEAEGKGLGNKVMAGLKAVAVSPETLGPEIAGYMFPSLAAGLLTGGASIPVQIGAQATVGAAQAAGSIKGDIYQSVRDYSREQGLSEIEADRAATEAQSYGGKNLDLILTNAGIGALAASTGAERIATRILTGRGQAVTKKTLGEFLKQGVVAGGVEAGTEGLQEAAEQISKNIADQRQGKDVPTFQNVPQVATMGAVAGGIIGGGLKGVEFLSAEEKEERDINRAAEMESRSLSATDATTKKVINDLNQSENAINSLRDELDTLEPTDPRAQQLRMQISEEQKKATGLKQSIGEEFLSEPITEAERQQIELGKLIAAPPEEKPKSAIEQINQERINLDERAKVFGAINARQFNTQNVLNENLTEEENTLLGDYANLQAKIQNLSWRDASQLSPEDFSVWQKPKFTDKATNDDELTDLGKLLSALDARGETKKADVVRKNIEGSKRKADWTIDSWQEKFDESKTQEEIDTINSDNNDWNDSVDTILDLVKQKTKPSAEEKPAAPVTAPTTQEGAKGMNLQEVSESAIAAFPDMIEAEGGLLPLTRFTPDEQASLRKAGIVETATTSIGETYEGVNAEYLWQRRKQLQDERAKKVQAPTAPTAEATPTPTEPTVKESLTVAPEAPAITPAPTPTEPATTEDIIGKKVTDSMGALPQKAGKARQALQGYIPVFKIGDFYEFIGEDAALSGSTIVGSGKSARSSLPYHQASKFQEIANKTGKPIAIISNTKVSEVINPITPAPVAETPAVAPAPKVAKPTGGIDYYKQLGEQDALDSNRKKKRAVPQNFKLAYEVGWSNARKKLRAEPTPAVSETITEDTRKTKVSDTQYQTEGVVPKENRFTEDEVRSIINEIFEGKIPDRVKIIEDETNPNLDFKGAYSLRAGTITYNLAYLAKGDDLRFVTNHELGHFIMGDPKFQAEMARLFDSLPTDIREKLIKAIDEAYTGESAGVRAEETIVFAFGEILENAPDGRNILQRFLDAIVDAINRLLKTKGYIPKNPKKAAAAILLAARNRFEQGEFIRRGDGSILKMTPTSPKDAMRDAEYLAAVERGDMETAQRMVDEKLANIGAFWHGTPSGDLRGGVTGLHVGTKQAAMEALEARIGIPADGKGWNGDKEYGKTLLAGRTRIEANEFGKYRLTGYNADAPNEDYYPTKMPTVGKGIPIDPTWKPWLRPVLIVGEMTNTQQSPISDAAANRRIQRKKGAFYTNEGEDTGSVSAVLPNGDSVRVKLADPVTYDDAGNVIPLSQRFQPSEPDIRRMAVRREKQGGAEVGPEIKTPKGIIAETKKQLREKFFDPSKVTEQNTIEAFRAIGKLIGNKKEAAAYAEEINDITRMIDPSGAASEATMGAALFINDLFEYAVKLAAQGQKMMLGVMMTNINKLTLSDSAGLSISGRNLRAAAERNANFKAMSDAEYNAFINYAAEFVYGPNPTKQQVDSIKIGYDAVEKVQEPTAKEVEEEIAAVGEKTGTDLVGRINDEFTKATEKGKAKRKTESEDLDAEYKKVQMKAESEIEKLAKIQSDTPAFARQVVNEIRAIIANDLKQRPDMESKAQWKSALVDKLQNAGVEPSRAERLTDLVWRQHEINNLSREIDSINKAVEKGPISEIIKAIKETPLEQQQNPNWRYEVMRDYLRKAGLSVAQAERIAKLMDISLQKRFTQAKEQAFTDAISKTAPWKAGDVRSKRAFQQVLQAIRAGALDPSRNMASDIAAMNGWTGFTADQYKNLLKFDAILADEKTGELEKANAYKGVQDIISKSKLPIRARDVIAQYYDAQALSGIPTLSVNSFSPIAFAMRNAIVQAGSGTIKGDAKAIGRAATEFVDSIKSWANTVAFSFKNNVTVYSNVDYIVNDDNLLRLYRKGVDQFTKSKNAKERADGVKNMMIGMMDYVRRILNALDYGAIAALQNQNISKYAMAVMKNKGMNNKQANEVFAAMMKEKNDFYLNQIAIGTDKNKARILADEFYISSWKKSLEKEGVTEEKIKSAMDAAINDALSSVGRNRQSLDAFKEEATNIKDAGLASSPALWLLESVANAANRSDSQFIKIFSRVIYGFAIVPARVIRETAWFSPYGFVRLAVDAALKKRNIESRYAQSLGSDFQRQQRLNEAIAGTVALFGLMALRASSTDDPEDEDEFKIVFTGNGPQRKDDPQFYDSWYKAGNKPNSMIVSFGKTKFTLNMMRGFEAFTWPAMMLGAIDDLEIRKKQKQQTKTPAQLEDAAIVAGFVFDAALRRGPYAFTTKSLFGTYGDIGVEGVAKGLTFPAKTLIPVLGTSLASNISNFLNDPIDRRTLDGAVWSNIPFIGPAVAPKSLNAFGEPSLSTDLASKMFKLGVPIVYDIPTDRESIKLHELVLKQGGGPSIPTRNQLAQRLDREPSNKEYEMFVKEYGALIKEDMKLNFEELSEATPELYSKYVDRIGLVARDIAETRVREKFEKP